MAMTRNKKIFISLVLASLFAIAAGGVFYLEKLLHLDTYKDQIIAMVQGELKRQVHYGKGDFSIRFGPAFTFDHVEIMEKEGDRQFLTAKRLTFKVAVLPLLEKKIVLKELLLEEPSVHIIREKNGEFNISDLLEQKKEVSTLHITGVRSKKGKVTFIDRMTGEEGVTTSLEDMDLSINRFVRGKTCSFSISALISDEQKKGVVSLGGTARLSPPGTSLTESELNGHIDMKHLDAGHYWPYYQKYVPFRMLTGRFSINSDFKGKLASFTSRGEMRFESLTFNYPEVFHAALNPRDINLRYEMELTPRDLTVKSVDLLVDGLRVKGSCALRDIHSSDLRITAQATTSQFDLEKFHQYIPYGVIAKDAAEFIEQHIKGGLYRLDEGTLDGRVSQIAHMEKGDNYNVLFVRGRVEKGLVTYGANVPTFNNINGELELRGKDFNLHRMSGNFGSSPFTLDGKISDYPLDAPSGYPFTMVMNPRQTEAAWLLDLHRTGKLFLNGPSTLHLSGNGFTSGYNISGDWDLSQAAYSYPDVISKPAGRVNAVTFKGSISKQDAKLSSLNFSMAPLHLTASADYRFTGKRRLTCEIKTNQFSAGEIAAMLPKLARYHPAGKMQANISGASRKEDIGTLQWAGDISFSGASLKLSDTMSTLSGITGAVRFGGNTLESSQMTVRLGNSTISGRGMLVDFRNPSFNLDFTSPALYLPDFGLRIPNKVMSINKVAGSLSLKDNNLNIRSLTGQVNNSDLSIRGNVLDLHNPKAELTVNSAHLELSDIVDLTELEPIGKTQGAPAPRFALKASVAAGTVKLGDHILEKLRTTASYENKILYLQPFECSAYGGHMSAKARFDFGSNGTHRHQISYSMNRLSTERLTRALGFKKQEITGACFLSGELTAKGSTAAEIKKTALGSAHLRIEGGTLRKFPVLSKIFSILNVSQLIKGRLPDMVSGGMPFNRITATLAVQDGIISSKDFYVDSNAMNISAVGKVDFVKDQTDVTIGVQPLQTVDKVVSHIPVVGWILTGKNKALITTYFEAKGKMEDPEVKAVPVKAMTKGVFNIFKRLFQLPAKLFTDTGEVIIGK